MMSPLRKPIVFERDESLANALRKVINQAEQQHSNDRALLLYAHRFALQPTYWNNSENRATFEKNLVQFILQYVHYLPALIEEFNTECEQAGWGSVAKQSNHIITAFFEKLDNPLRQSGLLGLIDKIYFAHRLIEENSRSTDVSFGFSGDRLEHDIGKSFNASIVGR